MCFDDNHAIHLERVDKNYPHLDILRRINEEAFPREERIDLSILFNSYEQFDVELNAIVDGEVPVGFTIWFDFGENYILWFYLAIDPQYQNCKYGTKTERIVFDELLKDNDEVEIQGIKVKMISTPGHTAGSCCYLIEEAGILLAGDTLFAGSCGRTDLPTGSGGKMSRSLKDVLMKLPDDVKVYPGHGGTTTIGYEKENNPFL